MKKRMAALKRVTKETKIAAKINLDGTGRSKIRTGIGFLDHMLESLTKHSLIDLEIKADGDLYIDQHHTNEDVGIALGEVFRKAVGDKKGIRRFGDYRAPLDEALSGVRVTLDLSGRGSFYTHTNSKTKWVDSPLLRAKKGEEGYGVFDAKHFLESFARTAGMTLHVDFISGDDAHHVIESAFKALAKAIRQAVEADPRAKGVPSTKGRL